MNDGKSGMAKQRSKAAGVPLLLNPTVSNLANSKVDDAYVLLEKKHVVAAEKNSYAASGPFGVLLWYMTIRSVRMPWG